MALSHALVQRPILKGRGAEAYYDQERRYPVTPEAQRVHGRRVHRGRRIRD